MIMNRKHRGDVQRALPRQMESQRLVARLIAYRALAVVALAVTGCGGRARLPLEAGIGVNPALPAPRTSFIPVVQVSEARGWKGNETPNIADGLAVNAFARDLDHPRWLYVLPNGD